MMINVFKWLINGYTNLKVMQLQRDVKQIRTELHSFQTEVLDDLASKMEKLQKRVHMRYKREIKEERETDEEKPSDPFDDIRKINKELGINK